MTNPSADEVPSFLGSAADLADLDTLADVQGRIRGEVFRTAELEEETAAQINGHSPCGLHFYPEGGRISCFRCAVERARIRAGFYDRAPISDDLEA